MKPFLIKFLPLLLPALLLLPLHALASAVVGQANSTSLSQGLVGYWPLDGATTNWLTGRTNDLSGQGNNGSLISMSTTTSSTLGKIGQALGFNGSTQYITTSSKVISTNDFSFSVWVKNGSASQTIDKTIFTNQNDTNNYGVVFSQRAAGSGNAYSIFYGNGSGTWVNIDQNRFALPLNTWTHVAFTKSGANTVIYINGAVWAATTQGTSVAAFANANNLMIAGSPSGSTRKWNGSIDDLRMYSRGLSAGEVQQLYTLGQANAAHANNVTLSSGLVGYWPLDGSNTVWTSATAGTVKDLSGNNTPATLNGMSRANSPTLGKIGGAMLFDGTTTNIVPNTTGLPTAIGTISAWIKTSNAGTSYRGIVQRNTAYGLYLINNIFGTYDSGGAATRSTGVALNDNKWHQVAMSFQSGVTNGTLLYIDGILSLTTTITATGQGNVYIGMGQGGAPQIFNGSIDDVRMYNRLLSGQEIKQLYTLDQVNVAHSNNVTLSTGLVGYWPFDGSATNWATGTTRDISGRGNSGSLIAMSTSTSVAIGKVGQALKFNGSNYVSVADVTALHLTGDVTYSMWAKFNSASASSDLIDKGCNGYSLFFAKGGTNKLQFSQQCHPTAQWAVATFTPTLGVWYHFVGTQAGGTTNLYINGVLAGSVVYTPTINSTLPITIGTGLDGNFNGSIDDVRIYNRALSAGEVVQLYAGAK